MPAARAVARGPSPRAARVLRSAGDALGSTCERRRPETHRMIHLRVHVCCVPNFPAGEMLLSIILLHESIQLRMKIARIYMTHDIAV
jgi:hypothetical protein